jgi:hypothetical protein
MGLPVLRARVPQAGQGQDVAFHIDVF